MAKTPKNSEFFVVFEGPDGSGKSTQAKLLADKLTAQGLDVLLTKEPGGTEVGQRIREILLNPANTGLDKKAELLLFAADRAQCRAKRSGRTSLPTPECRQAFPS